MITCPFLNAAHFLFTFSKGEKVLKSCFHFQKDSHFLDGAIVIKQSSILEVNIISKAAPPFEDELRACL